jgi:hypothetical protein
MLPSWSLRFWLRLACKALRESDETPGVAVIQLRAYCQILFTVRGTFMQKPLRNSDVADVAPTDVTLTGYDEQRLNAYFLLFDPANG